MSQPALEASNADERRSKVAVGANRLSRRRKLLFAAILVALIGAIGLAVGEFVCRITYPIHPHYELTDDPILFYRLTAGVDCVENGGRRTHTVQHLRGPMVYETHPPDGSLRVAWVGDSACFGNGVGDDQTAPYRLHAMARDRGLRLESINFGVVGYNVRQSLELVRRRCAGFGGIDAVIYYHHINDIVNAPWAGLGPFIPWRLFWDYERPGNVLVKLFKRSVLAYRLAHTDFVSSLLRRDVYRGADEAQSLPNVFPRGFMHQCASLYDERCPHGARFRSDLFAMADEAHNQGAAFCVVYFPVQGLLDDPASQAVSSALARWCGERSVPFVDMTGDFLVNRASPKLYADSTHPGVLGQRIVADAVWRALRLDSLQP